MRIKPDEEGQRYASSGGGVINTPTTTLPSAEMPSPPTAVMVLPRGGSPIGRKAACWAIAGVVATVSVDGTAPRKITRTMDDHFPRELTTSAPERCLRLPGSTAMGHTGTFRFMGG